MKLFHGVGAAIVTPFDGQDRIDYAVWDRYIDYLTDNGVAALIAFGTTGEPATVTADEYEQAVAHIIAHVRGRLPVIVGAGSNSTAVAVQKAALAKKLGATGVLAVTPYYNKCTQRGIIEHYKRMADVGIPVIAYNVPSRTGVNILPATVKELAQIKGIVGLKEACGNIDQFAATARVCGENGLAMYSGDDNITAIAMMLGCDGVISVAANPAPRLMVTLCELCDRNEYKKARDLQFKLADLISALFAEVNPIPVKKAMQLLGYEVGAPRLPLTESESDNTLKLKQELRKVGLL